MTVKQLKESIAGLDENKLIKVWSSEEGYWGLLDITNVQDNLTVVTIELDERAT